MNLIFALGPVELIILLFVLVLPIIALIDILGGRFEPMGKLIWVLIILFLPIFGSILYFLIGRRNKISD